MLCGGFIFLPRNFWPLTNGLLVRLRSSCIKPHTATNTCSPGMAPGRQGGGVMNGKLLIFHVWLFPGWDQPRGNSGGGMMFVPFRLSTTSNHRRGGINQAFFLDPAHVHTPTHGMVWPGEHVLLVSNFCRYRRVGRYALTRSRYNLWHVSGDAGGCSERAEWIAR